MSPNGSAPETTPTTPTIPETPVSITGNPEDATLMQAAAEAARNVSGVEQTPNPILPGTEVTVPDFAKPTPSEAPQAEAPALIGEVPSAVTPATPEVAPVTPPAVSSEAIPPVPSAPVAEAPQSAAPTETPELPQ